MGRMNRTNYNYYSYRPLISDWSNNPTYTIEWQIHNLPITKQRYVGFRMKLSEEIGECLAQLGNIYRIKYDDKSITEIDYGSNNRKELKIRQKKLQSLLNELDNMVTIKR